MGRLKLHLLVYGSSGIVLEESLDVEYLQSQADILNERAPHYNHRVIEAPVKKADK